MFRSFPLTARFIAFVLLPLLIALGAGARLALRSLPATEGKQVAGAIKERLTIARDRNGVVYIDARTDADAFFALGYAHAQDRLWQLELQRRIARGRLSELLGKRAIAQDAWMRTLGLYEAAESSWPALSAAAQASLTAYAQGINAWLKTAPVLPIEFMAFGIAPQPWSELDSLAWAKVFALNLSNNMKSEVANLIASQYLNAAQLTELTGMRPQESLAASGNVAQELRAFAARFVALERDRQQHWKIGGAYVGSNAWVIAGKHTADGLPILANDAHLGLQVPSLWYVAQLRGDRLDVAGMTLVGLPVVVFGRNRDIVWGGTSLMADVQDLYVEQLNPSDPTQYRSLETWRTFETRTETIDVKAEFPASLRDPPKPAEIRVRKTLHGPIVSDALGALEQPVALRWTALDPGDTTYEAFYRLNYASDWSAFQEASALIVAPALNLLYADSRGNIGAIAVGRIPVRAKGNGRLPVPGWSAEYRWTGHIPFTALPQRYNPAEGYLVSANDAGIAGDSASFISAEWAPPERAHRITQLIRASLERGKRLSTDDMGRMQADTVDLGARQLVDFLKRAPLERSRHREALGHLAQWSGDMSLHSQGATIFYAWTRHLREELFAAQFPEYWNESQQHEELDALVASATDAQLLDALMGSPARWCDRTSKAGERSCHAILERSLERALVELTSLQGSDMEDWRWGDVHSTLYAHLPFSRLEPVNALFERRIASGGSPNTINVASAEYRKAVGYEQTFGAGFRQIVSLGESGARHIYMNSTGQSGNVLSPHYDDMVEPFRDVRYYPLERPATQGRFSTLVLSPR